MSQELLDHTKAQGYKNYRRPIPGRVSLYADDMRNRRWRYTAEPLTVRRPDGVLLEGQNRCLASIKANASFEALVVYDEVDEQAVDAMGLGAPRTLRDTLERKGVGKADVLAAAVPFVYNWEKTKCLARDLTTHGSRMAMLECLNRHPRLIDYVQKNKNLHDLGLPDSFTSALRYVLVMSSNEEAAYQFLGEVGIGDQLSNRSPVFQLRKRLLRDALGNASKLQKRVKIALVTKAWNLWLSGQECLMLKWTSVGPGAEEFPEVLTLAQIDTEAQ